MSSSDDYIIAIRPMNASDAKGVQQVFKDGAFSNILPAFKLDTQKKPFQCIVLITLAIVIAVGQTNVGVLHIILTLLGCFTVLLAFETIGALMYVYGPHSYLSDVNSFSKLKEAYLTNKDTCFWVAESVMNRDKSKEIVGTIAIGYKRKDTAHVPEVNKKVAWLRRMAVKKRYRRLGIARRLVLTAITFCVENGYDQIELITTDIHAPAKRLYEQIGFHCISHRPHLYFKGYLKVWMYEYVFNCNEISRKMRGSNSEDPGF